MGLPQASLIFMVLDGRKVQVDFQVSYCSERPASFSVSTETDLNKKLKKV